MPDFLRHYYAISRFHFAITPLAATLTAATFIDS
jgi:hypothetical protein